MNLMIIIFIGISFAVLFLFLYMLARDKAIDKKFNLISAALENINQEIYKIQKQQKDNSLQNIESLISSQLDGILENLIESVKHTQLKNKHDIDLLYDKVTKLEQNVKTISLPHMDIDSSSDKKEQTKRVKDLYEIGYSIEEIAKDVGLPAGEVQLLLKF